jgi:K+-sensing histidine kinase KdpD
MKIFPSDRLWRVLALLLCSLAAWGVSMVHWRASWRGFVPFGFLLLVLALGAMYGRTVGILGSVIAALVFAHSMYEPVGSLYVDQQAARSSLAWMLLAGVSLSFLLLPPSASHHRK